MKQDEFQTLKDSEKLDEIYKSAEKMRMYFKWTLIISVAVIIIPLLFMPFAIMRFLGAYNINSLGL